MWDCAWDKMSGLAPLPGCEESLLLEKPVVSLRSTTGYRLSSLRDKTCPRGANGGLPSGLQFGFLTGVARSNRFRKNTTTM